MKNRSKLILISLAIIALILSMTDILEEYNNIIFPVLLFLAVVVAIRADGLRFFKRKN